MTAPRWARLRFGGKVKRWHAIDGHRALCGAVDLNHPRAEYSESKPESGKVCRRCVASLGATGGA